MSDFNNPAENTIYGSFGEFGSFDETADWSDQDWRDYDTALAADMARYDAEQDRDDAVNFYWETEAEVRLAYYDEPDMPF